MPTPTKLVSLTATEFLNLIERDQLTIEDYANALLDRIRSRDGVVKAWQYLGTPSAPAIL
jgi:Asp-tRNA(Asn)/Glu-tRNA(Gln) amidotransferase A subunit family amidase